MVTLRVAAAEEERMIDMMFAAGLMTAARGDDENRYAGTTMWSALPDAPVVAERAPRFRRLRARLAQLRLGRTGGDSAAMDREGRGCDPIAGPAALGGAAVVPR
jgi:hypothetical protein